MAEHLETGKKAEDIAAEYLIGKGYQILHRNYRYGRAEVDLIVRKGICLVFVEVKSLSNLKYGMPEIGVNKHKVAMITKAADFYVYKNNWHQQIRFDIVAVIFRKDTYEVSHFEDAFY